MKLFLLVAAPFVATLAFAPNPTGAADSPEAEVRAVEVVRTTALVRGDVAALEKVMADDVTYVHASGKSDTKTSYLAALRSGQLRYLLWQPHQVNVRMMGETAILNGMYYVRAIDLRVQKDPIEINVYFLSVYAHRDGRWQQIAWQTTRAPAAPQKQ